MLATGSRKKLEGISISKMMVSSARYRIKVRFATKAVVFVVGSFSNDVLKSDFSLSLSQYTSPILSHRSKQFQRYNDGWLFQHDAERRSYRSIPSDKNDRNYKKIHNSIYTVTRAIHTRLDYRAHFSLSFFSFFSFLRRQF